ncbi:hypothetical protein [Phenylobacterium kunshanense]|uniref:hypothetical protein n=1 Tax=Phenylobacterium kunshanense TaxID=1445034 RepID=UPI0014024AF1|nr:hypothetical protein [Phenylobacterium kunshanense]
MSLRIPIAVLIALALAAPASAQIPLIIPFPVKPRAPAGPPANLPAHEAEIWPYPPPDPKSWWEDKRPKPAEASDPLGGRKLRRGERLAVPDNGVDASTYRLWALMPLQWQLVRGEEMILEVWTRPASSVRQTVTRVTVRSDGKAFVQARAGLACCDASIGRRLGFDAELPDGAAQRFRALRDLPIWRSPRDVRVAQPGMADALCVEGTGYDVTLLTSARAVTLHRACDPAEVGEIADVLESVLGAAMGHDPRFDVIFPRGVDFKGARAAHQELIASGGRLKPNPDARRPPAGHEPAPEADERPAALGPSNPEP